MFFEGLLHFGMCDSCAYHLFLPYLNKIEKKCQMKPKSLFLIPFRIHLFIESVIAHIPRKYLGLESKDIYLIKKLSF